MAGTYRYTELVGTSSTSFAEAVKAAVSEAYGPTRMVLEVIRETGKIENGQVKEFQVAIKVGCKIVNTH